MPKHRVSLPPELEWMEHAACLDQDPDLFFPLSAQAASQVQVEEAKSVCADCLVCGLCLRYALTTYQQAGIWGGLTEEERLRIQRQRVHDRKNARRRAALRH